MNFKDFDLHSLITIAFYIGVGIVFYLVIMRIVHLIFRKPGHSSGVKMSEEQVRKFETARGMVMSIFKYMIILGVIVAALATFGVNVSSILAGAGIFAAIAGLAFQDLGKDIIAGFTVLADGQYKVGDWIQVGDFTGVVTSVGLKTTRVQDYHGQIKIISNRNMDTVINYSMDKTLAEVIVTVSKENDPDRVEEALERVKKRADGRMAEMQGEIVIVGPDETADGKNVYWQVRVECGPYEHLGVQRMIQREVMREIHAKHIKPAVEPVEVKR